MKITRCEVCVGRKVINGLGGMEKKCHECKGVGHVELIEDEIEYLGKSDAVINSEYLEAFASFEKLTIVPTDKEEDKTVEIVTPKKKPTKKPRSSNGKK